MSLIENSSLTIGEFCAIEKISRGHFYKLRRLGLGPREMDVAGVTRISPQARLDWHRDRETASAA